MFVCTLNLLVGGTKRTFPNGMIPLIDILFFADWFLFVLVTSGLSRMECHLYLIGYLFPLHFHFILIVCFYFNRGNFIRLLVWLRTLGDHGLLHWFPPMSRPWTHPTWGSGSAFAHMCYLAPLVLLHLLAFYCSQWFDLA